MSIATIRTVAALIAVFFSCVLTMHGQDVRGDSLVGDKNNQDSVASFSDPKESLTVSDTIPEKIPKKRRKSINEFIEGWQRDFEKTFDDIDETWIEPNFYNYSFMLQNTNVYQSYYIRAGNDNGRKQSIQLNPTAAFRIGPYFGWRWLFLGYTFDVARPQKAGKQTEFTLSLYSSRIGFDFVYVKNNGNYTIGRVSGFDSLKTNVRGVKFNGMRNNTLSFNLYYVFNHKHFSYPAAFSQSTIQRKSCGSWMLGLRYDKQKCTFNHELLPPELRGENDEYLMDELKNTGYDYQNYNISFGYGYNWVCARNLLLAVSVMPSLGYRHTKGQSHNESLQTVTKNMWMDVRNLNVDVVSRLGFVWNTSRWYVGTSVVNHLFNYGKSNYSVTNALTYFNVYAGINFYKKKKYHKNGERRW